MIDQKLAEERARAVLRKPDTVLLVGSGLSLWSGLPSWYGLLERLSNALRRLGRDTTNTDRELATGDLLLAASYATHNLAPRDLGNFLRAELAGAQPSACHSTVSQLGPTCFITTNYDTLIEDSVQAASGKRPLVVSNLQTAELAEIVPASSRDFVYKYHGDIADVESIVLSREHYRKLLHSRSAATKAFESLIATRPVVMIGFGLKDPDFLYMQDDLVDAFNGQSGEYYAILPDMNEDHVRYWRETYRIEVLSYDTKKLPDGSISHENFHELLKRLTPAPSPTTADFSPPEQPNGLLLARLGAAMKRLRPDKGALPLPLMVERDRRSRSEAAAPTSRFYAGTLEEFFDEAPAASILLGNPGSGKTYSIRSRVGQLASALTDACLSGEDISTTTIPIYVSLSSYSGTVEDLVSKALPVGLSLSQINSTGQAIIFLDAANEAPKEFIESSRIVEDIKSFMTKNSGARFVISSRPESWIQALDLPSYTIGDIPAKFIHDSLQSLEWVSVLQNPEIVRALTRPLLFNMVLESAMAPSMVRAPADIYRSYFDKASQSVSALISQPVDVQELLAEVAYEMLSEGIEVGSRARLIELFQQFGDESAPKLLDALIQSGVLIPLSEGRFTFFHQSGTEYLAAIRLCREYVKDSRVLQAHMSNKRWDQALFLLFGLLPPRQRSKFFRDIVSLDVVAAARAAFYADEGIGEFVSALLGHLAERPEEELSEDWILVHHLQPLPTSISVLDQLEQISQTEGALGGWAAARSSQVSEGQASECVTRALIRGAANDYNYVVQFATNAPELVKGHLPEIVEFLKGVPDLDAFHPLGDVEGVLADFSDDEIEELALHQSAASGFVLSALTEADGNKSLPLIKRLIRRGVSGASFALYIGLKYGEVDQLSYQYDQDLLKSLFDLLATPEGLWAAKSVSFLGSVSERWFDETKYFCESYPDKIRPIVEFLVNQDAESVDISGLIESFSHIDKVYIDVLLDCNWNLVPVTQVNRFLSMLDSEQLERVLFQFQGRINDVDLSSIRPISSWIDEALVSGGRFMTMRFLLNGGEENTSSLVNYITNASDDEILRLMELCQGYGFAWSHAAVNRRILNLALKNVELVGCADFLGANMPEQFVEEEVLQLIDSRPEPGFRRALKAAGDRHNRRYLLLP